MPTRRIFSRIHAIAGVLAFVTILMFLSSSLAAELWGKRRRDRRRQAGHRLGAA